MLLLTTTSDIIQVVTGSAVSSINVHASYVDITTTTLTPGRTNTLITTATTTTIVASPAASTQRQIKAITIRNSSGSGCVVTVRHFDGTTTIELISYTLNPGETLEYMDGKGFKTITAYGEVKMIGLFSGVGVALQGSGTSVHSTGTVQFSNSNGVSFGLNAGVMTASVVPGGGGAALSAGTQSVSSGTVNFANSNGITFGMSLSSQITASHNGLTTAALSDHSHGVTLNLTNLAGTTGGGSAGINLSLSATSQSVQPGIQSISGGTTRITTGEVVFSNSNGISAGVNGQTITFSHNGLTTAAISEHTHGAGNVFLTNFSATIQSTSNAWSLSLSAAAPGGGGVAISASDSLYTSGTVLFTGSNNITVSRSGAGQTVIISGPNTHAQQTGISGIAGSAASTVTNGTVQFSNSNGISFGLNGSTMTASHNALTSQSNQAFSASGGSSAFQTIDFQSSNGITFSNNAGAIRVSHDLQYTSNTSNIITGRAGTGTTSAGTNASISMTLNTAGLNLAVSVNPPGAGGGAALSAGTQSVNTGTVNFADSNGITFGMSLSSQITASHNGLTTAALSNHSHGFSASGGSSAFQTLNFANSNGITFSNSAGSVIASHNGLTTAAPSNHSHGFSASGGSSAFQTLNFANSNGITFSNSAGSVIASHNGLTTAALSNHSHGVTLNLTNLSGTTAGDSAGINLSLSAAAPGGGGGFAAQGSGTYTQNTGTIQFANSNGITFGLSTNQMTASHNGLTSQSNQAFSASGGSSAFQTLEFQNSNGITFSNNAGSLRATHDLQYTSNTSNIITGRAGTGTTFAGANISASMTLNTNGLNMSASVAAPGGGGAHTYSFWDPYMDQVHITGTLGAGSIMFNPLQFPNVVFDRVIFKVSQSNSSNSTGTLSCSICFGLYTREASSRLSLYMSSSTSFSVPYSGNASTSLYAGPRHVSMGWTTTVTEGMYWVGIGFSTNTGGNNCTLNHILMSQNTYGYFGLMGVASASSFHRVLGQGRLAAATSVCPNSVPFTSINGMSTAYFRPPMFHVMSQTF